jgi:hypothetical protein
MAKKKSKTEDVVDEPSGYDFASIVSSDGGRSLMPHLMCPACGHGVQHKTHAVPIVSITRKKNTFSVNGSISAFCCPMCGRAMQAITESVPVELKGLRCGCGSEDFDFEIASVERGKSTKSDWNFEVIVTCKQCKTKDNIVRRIARLVGLRRITITPTGIDVRMKSG